MGLGEDSKSLLGSSGRSPHCSESLSLSPDVENRTGNLSTIVLLSLFAVGTALVHLVSYNQVIQFGIRNFLGNSARDPFLNPIQDL